VVDSLVLFSHFLTHLLDILSFNKGTEKTSGWVVILEGRWLLEHQFLDLLGLQAQLASCVVRDRASVELAISSALFNDLLKF